MNIYVGNIPRNTQEQDLMQLFSAFGEISSVNIIKDKFTGEGRGFGFVEMPDANAAQAAISGLNGKQFMGRSLTVNEARPRNDDRRGSGRRGGYAGGNREGGRRGGRGHTGFGGGRRPR